MNKIHRVFFHELGHFVARELNLKYFDGTGSSEVKIYPCQCDYSEYCGHITPIRPSDDLSPNASVPLERLAEYLAALLYGCVFQSYHSNTCLEDITKKYGNDDMGKWLGSLIDSNLARLNSEIFRLSLEHLDTLRGNKLLDNFMQVVPETYLVETGSRHFSVDLEMLRVDIFPFIEELYPYYNVYVRRHQEIINSFKYKHT